MKLRQRWLAHRADPEELVSLVEAWGQQSGYRVVRAKTGDEIAITGRSEHHWYSILLRNLAPSFKWLVRVEQPNETVLLYDYYYVWWLRCVIAVLALVSGIILMWGMILHLAPAQTPSLDNLQMPQSGLGLVALAMVPMFLLIRYSCSNGSAQSSAMTLCIRRRLQEMGGDLVQDRHRFRSRAQLRGTILLAFILTIVCVGFIAAAPDHSGMPLWVRSILALLLFGAGVLSLTQFSSAEGFGTRLAFSTQGLLNMAIILAGSMPLVAACMATAVPTDIWERILAAARALDNGGGPLVTSTGEVISREPTQTIMTLVTSTLMMIVAAIPFGALIAIVVSIEFIARVGEVNELGLRLRSERGPHAMDAIGGAPFLGRFRAILITVWVVFGVCGMVSLYCTIAIAIRSIKPLGPSLQGCFDLTEPVRATAYVYRVLCAPRVEQALAESYARCLWIAAGCLATGVILASAGSWAMTRWRAFREMHDNHRLADACVTTRVERLLRTLLPDALGKLVRAAVVEGASPHVSTHVRGPLLNRCIIEVSTGCVANLEDEELHAVLAHEVSHFCSYHCWWHTVLHGLGRLTCVGSAYVGVLENTVGRELVADRMAVERFGVHPDALRRALLKMRAITGLALMAGTRGSPFSHGGCGEVALRNSWLWLRTWEWVKKSIQTWWGLYAHESALAYWHPSVDERLAILEKLASKRQSQQAVQRLD